VCSSDLLAESNAPALRDLDSRLTRLGADVEASSKAVAAMRARMAVLEYPSAGPAAAIGAAAAAGMAAASGATAAVR
jgi:hypothetical protein